MNNKNLTVLVAVAVVLGGAAYFLSSGTKASVPKINGQKIVPSFDLSAVAQIDVGGKLKLAGSEKGWVVESYHGYPADRAKIADNLLKLQELTVGQLARGRKLGAETLVALKDAAGKPVAEVKLGDRHAKWGHGRYVAYQGETVLVKDTLDAFGDDPKQWIETKIVDEPWISFNEIADEKLTEAELGFATGVVAKVTIAGDTNRVATIGGTVKGGTDRYLKLDGQKWVFQVPSYSVDRLLPKPEPKEEPKAAEPVASEKTDEQK